LVGPALKTTRAAVVCVVDHVDFTTIGVIVVAVFEAIVAVKHDAHTGAT